MKPKFEITDWNIVLDIDKGRGISAMISIQYIKRQPRGFEIYCPALKLSQEQIREIIYILINPRSKRVPTKARVADATKYIKSLLPDQIELNLETATIDL